MGFGEAPVELGTGSGQLQHRFSQPDGLLGRSSGHRQQQVTVAQHLDKPLPKQAKLQMAPPQHNFLSPPAWFSQGPPQGRHCRQDLARAQFPHQGRLQPQGPRSLQGLRQPLEHLQHQQQICLGFG